MRNDKAGRPEHNAMAIVSGYKYGKTEHENNMATYDILARLRGSGIECGIVEGMYKGQRELSVLAELRGVLDWQRVLQAAHRYEQESVLHIDVNRIATLFHIVYEVGQTPEDVTLGKLVPVSPTKAATLDAWTKIKTGQHYAVL